MSSGTSGDTMQLCLLRHAHAGDPESWTGDDDERPLSDKGRRHANALGRFLKDVGFAPGAIVSSPKVRALQTADAVADALGMKVGRDRRLADHVGVEVVEAVIADAGQPDLVVLVGHDPDFSALVALLCGASGVPMRKGALARIDCARPLTPGTGTLRWLVPPDLLSRG